MNYDNEISCKVLKPCFCGWGEMYVHHASEYLKYSANYNSFMICKGRPSVIDLQNCKIP